jgi:cytochrome c-type biogenesis protein CcsB
VAVNHGLAELSDHLLAGTVLSYALAMGGYAAELAFGRALRRVPDTEQAEPAEAFAAFAAAREAGARAKVPALVGAGAPAAAEAAEADEPAGDAPVAGVVAPDDPRRAAGRRAALLGRAAVALTVLGWGLHVGSVATRGFAAHRPPWGNMYEFSSMICLVTVTAFLGLLIRTSQRWLGVFVMLPVVCYLGFAGTVLYTPAGPLVPALNSYWLKIHVVAAILASGVFVLSGVVTVLYLLKERYEGRTADAGGADAGVDAGGADAGGADARGAGDATVGVLRTRGGIMTRLPSSASLDRTAYRLIAFAFPVWTFAVIAGAIWAEAAWGRYWGWDPKETWSFITWVCYAAYLHARVTAGWKGRRAAIVSMVAFSALFIDYYLVNLVISGLHSYAGV